MATWKKIVLGLVVMIGCVVGLVFWLTSGLTDTIDRQIAAINKGDIDAVYAETSIAFRQSTSKEKLAAFLKARPVLSTVTDRTFSSRSMKSNQGTVKGTLTTKSGAVIPVEYRLVKEKGDWKIIFFKYGIK